MVSSTHEQNSICSQKQLNNIAHEHTIICRQLFAGHVVGSRPMKRKKHLHRMINIIDSPLWLSLFEKHDSCLNVVSDTVFDEKLFNNKDSVYSILFCCSMQKFKNFID